MTPILRAVPKLCFTVATLLFLGQSYFLIRGSIQGYDYGFAVDLKRDLAVQYVMIWVKVAVNALVWVAFGLLTRLLIQAIDNLNAAGGLVAGNSAEATKDA